MKIKIYLLFERWTTKIVILLSHYDYDFSVEIIKIWICTSHAENWSCFTVMNILTDLISSMTKLGKHVYQIYLGIAHQACRRESQRTFEWVTESFEYILMDHENFYKIYKWPEDLYFFQFRKFCFLVISFQNLKLTDHCKNVTLECMKLTTGYNVRGSYWMRALKRVGRLIDFLYQHLQEDKILYNQKKSKRKN